MSNNGLKNKILLIFNPAAGKKKALKTEIFGVNGASEAKFKIKRTKSPGHATELAKKNRDKYLIVTAIGGDGTVNEVASGLVNTDIPLGIIPNGSGNGLARELGIPMNKKKAFDLLKKSTPIHIDTLLLNDHPCVNMAGIGFDTRVAHFFDKMKARGFLNYIQATLKLMHTYKPLHIKMLLDETQKVDEKVFLCSFANSRQFGNNAFIAPDAKLNDGLIHIAILRPFPWYAAPVLAWQLFSKKIHLSPYYQSFTAGKCILDLEKELEMHIDGEPKIVQGPVQITVKPSSLRVIGTLSH